MHNRELKSLPKVLENAGKWGLTPEQLAEQVGKIKVRFEWGGTPEPKPDHTARPKRKPKAYERWPDTSRFYDWVCAHHESPLWPVLRDSGYLGDQQFIERTVRGYDGWQWRWFFSVQRGVKKEIWREQWARFVADARREQRLVN